MTHYGNEPMCALNDVLVFGKSAAEDLEDQLSDTALLPDDPPPTTPKSDPSIPSKPGPQPEAHTSPEPEGQQQQASTGQSSRPLAAAAQQSHGVTAVKTDLGHLNSSDTTALLNVSGDADQQSRSSGNQAIMPPCPMMLL